MKTNKTHNAENPSSPLCSQNVSLLVKIEGDLDTSKLEKSYMEKRLEKTKFRYSVLIKAYFKTNKTETSKVGTISKAKKEQSFLNMPRTFMKSF